MRGSLLKRHFQFGCVALALVLVLPGSASAFYWAGWPGSGTYEPQSISPRQLVSEQSVPQITTLDPSSNSSPKGVPEPATLVIAGLGLGVIAVRKVLKRKK